MAGGICVLGGVAIRRIVTTKRRPALLTGAQVDPLAADFHTLHALSSFRVLNGRNRAEMRAALIRRHRSIVPPQQGCAQPA